MTAPSGRHPAHPAHPAHPHTEAPHEYAPAPPAWWVRWGWLLGVLAMAGALAVWLGISPPYQSRAEAQQQAQAGSAALTRAQAECAAQLQTAVGAQTAQLRSLDSRMVRLEAQQATQLYLLQLLAQRLQVPIPSGTAIPMPAPGGQPLVP